MKNVPEVITDIQKLCKEVRRGHAEDLKGYLDDHRDELISRDILERGEDLYRQVLYRYEKMMIADRIHTDLASEVSEMMQNKPITRCCAKLLLLMSSINDAPLRSALITNNLVDAID